MSAPEQPREERTDADRVADAVIGVRGVAGLHAGSFGEVATYLPGRRVTGVRMGERATTVHVSVTFGSDIREVADGVRTAVAAQVPGAVEVVVEDVVDPTAPARQPEDDRGA